MRQRLRRLFPPSGLAYELFDNAVFVAVIVAVGYVLEGPQPAQQQTLGFIEQIVSLHLWGIVLAGCAIAAAIAAYVPAWVSAGYGILSAGCFFWSGAFIVGIVFFDGEARSTVSALIYAWVLRRLVVTKLRGF